MLRDNPQARKPCDSFASFTLILVSLATFAQILLIKNKT
ncbi:hypothetical protein LYNGBM3L_41640 [Moorena producens 3L]|uniref:Uncharacterized protein n=1 Tax=Moorena producens 3L TaxID=489825 RepID=F4XVQ7_9CYAN|nr:hypothetical protein LYNGBM3L_41640 [Moorena producens 3L]